ncbi:MAG: polysaccharide deacetylase family protein [Gracilimonas sp.]
MKIRLTTFMLFTALCTSQIQGQNIGEGFEIGGWKDFKTAAISYTFDDNFSNQLGVIVPIFDEFDYKLTLFTFTNSFNAADWDGLNEAVENGHEIGSHTVTHSNLSELSDEQQIKELADSKETIETNIPGYKVQTIAYPFCVPGNDDLTSQYYIAARGCSGQIVPKTPSNFMNISSMIIGTEGYSTTEALNGRADAAVSSGGWAIFLGHDLDSNSGYSPVSSEEIRGNLEYISETPSKFWVDSFGNVVKYIQERNAASVTEVSANENKIEVEITDTLDNSIYDHPLTIRRVLPEDWDSAAVTQDTLKLEVRIIVNGDQKFAQFNAIPDAGLITLEKAVATSTENNGHEKSQSFNLIQNYPNPFNPSTNIVYDVQKSGKVKIVVYNTLGRNIETLVNEIKTPGKYTVQWDGTNEASGTYFYRYDTEEFMRTGTMQLIK